MIMNWTRKSGDDYVGDTFQLIPILLLAVFIYAADTCLKRNGKIWFDCVSVCGDRLRCRAVE
jgi:hypothetical protein